MKLHYILGLTGIGLSFSMLSDNDDIPFRKPADYQEQLSFQYFPTVFHAAMRVDSVLKDTLGAPAGKREAIEKVFAQEARKFSMVQDSVELNMDERIDIDTVGVERVRDVFVYTETKKGRSDKFLAGRSLN